MANSLFERSMRNTDFGNRGRHRVKKNNDSMDNFTFQIAIDPLEVTKINRHMKEELAYYNNIVTNMTALLRRDPQFIMNLSPEHSRLFGDLAYCPIDLTTLAYRKKLDDVVLPESLKLHEGFLLGVDKAQKRHLTEKLLSFFNMVSIQAGVLPNTRRTMAENILRFHKDQAEIILRGSGGQDQMYKATPHFLETPDIIRKRHLQMLKSDMRFEWDEANDQTLVSIPYVSRKISIPNWNFNEHKNWHIAILHQEPGSMISSKTPWVLEFRHNPTGYLIKYLDVANPGRSAFDVAKRGRSAFS